MSNLQRRMDALEAAQARRQYRMIAATAAEYGLSADELMEEAHEFFALPLAEQLIPLPNSRERILCPTDLQSRVGRGARGSIIGLFV
jgi:hypothetical protein